ncbi:hypothetical protein [Ectobacillus ponti]|uniref:Uncharacterized protein n=1 Tax=Ectobacillus ponti TaxID=2961894 RepID=A0AA41X645_9BACI|nr:hypothetical protein [Ectobacillus ponti]MCP8967013.1 hypothetical protein [Ectobacillus ponti]
MKHVPALLSCMFGLLSVSPFVLPGLTLLVFLPLDTVGLLLGLLSLQQPSGRLYAAAGVMLCSLTVAFKLLALLRL